VGEAGSVVDHSQASRSDLGDRAFFELGSVGARGTQPIAATGSWDAPASRSLLVIAETLRLFADCPEDDHSGK
jgi:hypothetical protein